MRSTCPARGAYTDCPTFLPVPKSKPAWKWPWRYSPKPPVTSSGGVSGDLASGASKGFAAGSAGEAGFFAADDEAVFFAAVADEVAGFFAAVADDEADFFGAVVEGAADLFVGVAPPASRRIRKRRIARSIPWLIGSAPSPPFARMGIWGGTAVRVA